MIQTIPIIATQSHDHEDTKMPLKVVPPQWQSTRRVASSVPGGSTRIGAHQADGWATKGASELSVVHPSIVPPLDLSKLATTSAAATHPALEPHAAPSDGDGNVERKKTSFETTFMRQARFATSLKRK